MSSPLIDAGGEERWFRFLSRWSLFYGLAFLGLMFIFMVGMLPATANSSLGQDYRELAMASSSPALYRLWAIFDLATWLGIAGFLLALAAILARHAPLRSVLIGACGITQVAGVLGAFMRVEGIGNLAARYAGAATDQQAALLRSSLDIQLVLTSHFTLGQLLYSIAYLLVASAIWSLAGFPRWLTIGLALVGIIGLASVAYHIVTLSFSPAFLLQVFLQIVTAFAIAWLFWRPKPALTHLGSDVYAG